MDKIKQWIELNGGRYTVNVDRQTTHLVCSKERYKKPNPLGRVLHLQHHLGPVYSCVIKISLMHNSYDANIWKVKRAKAAAHVKIVTYDWLEDSLLAKRRKADKNYLLSRITKTTAKKKVITAAARRKQLEEGG